MNTGGQSGGGKEAINTDGQSGGELFWPLILIKTDELFPSLVWVCPQPPKQQRFHLLINCNTDW